MSGVRQSFLDISPGERRAVVTLDGRPERLLVERDGDSLLHRLGARLAARVRRVERAQGLAYVDVGEPPDAVLDLAGAARTLGEGARVEVEITAEPRRGKGATVSLIGPCERPPGLISPGPDLLQRLAALCPGAEPATGEAAREAADLAQDMALAMEHPLPGGGSVAIEPTRALVAVDVDLGGRAGADGRRRTLDGNRAAISETARLLRLKALGGLVVFDLAGRGQDGEALQAAARSAFAPDQPGVVLGPLNRLGTFTLALPQRRRPIAEILLTPDGVLSPRSVALRLVRALEREGRGDPGALLVGVCAPDVAAIAAPLVATLGPRFGVEAQLGMSGPQTDIRRR